MKRNYTNILLATALILIAALARIVNREMHLYNLAPVAAIGLFSGAIIKDKRISFILPLLAMLLSDAYFQLFTNMQGFYGQEQLWVYGGMALVTFMGTRMGNTNAVKVAGFSLAGSLVFFIVSNFGSFLSGMWGRDLNGLATTYIAAIPFLKNTIVSDMVGNGLLFGLYFSMQRALRPAAQKA